MSEHDAGDEDDGRPPSPPSDLDLLLADDPMPHDLFDVVTDTAFARSCCRACAVEANGEDGS